MGESAQTAATANTTTAQPAQNNYGGMALTGTGGVISAWSQYEAGKYNRRIAGINAGLARTQGEQALQTGTLAANRLEGRERQVEGADASAAAAGNTIVGAGSNRAVIASNRAASAMDQMMIERNARREAFGYQARAIADEAAGSQALLTGKVNAAATLLNTGAQEYLETDPSYAGFRGRGIQFS